MTARDHFVAAALSLSCLTPLDALAGTSNGAPALALAAIVGQSAPAMGALDRRLLLAYLNGRADAPHAEGKQVAVKADAVDCRASNVDITSHACTLSFGAKKIELAGRAAHELYATLIENGVAADAGAGTVHEAVTDLDCLIDADEVAQKAGGGARCAFKP